VGDTGGAKSPLPKRPHADRLLQQQKKKFLFSTTRRLSISGSILYSFRFARVFGARITKSYFDRETTRLLPLCYFFVPFTFIGGERSGPPFVPFRPFSFARKHAGPEDRTPKSAQTSLCFFFFKVPFSQIPTSSSQKGYAWD
jgi:hypothetical protein